MALIDRKIPILTGINDTPSTTGQPNHPNASLLCKQYNDLIDNELTALQLNRDNRPYVFYTEVIVNTTTGNDTTGDGTEALPYATIQRAIDHYTQSNRTGYCYIIVTGNFTNPSLDFSGIYGIVGSPVYDTFEGLNIEDNVYYGAIEVYASGSATITYDYEYDNVNYESTESPRSYVVSPNDYVLFSGITFNIAGTEPMKLNDSKVAFNSCTINHTHASFESQNVFAVVHSNLIFNNCTFNYDSSKTYTAIGAFNSKLYLKNVVINDTHINDAPRLGEIVDCTLVLGGITTTNTAMLPCMARRNVIFGNYADETALETATGIIPARNLIKCSGVLV